MARLLYCTAFALPCFVSLLVLASLILHGTARLRVGAMVLLLLASAYVGRYFYRRSKNLEAVLVSTRIQPTDTEDRKASADFGALACAALIVAAAAKVFFS